MDLNDRMAIAAQPGTAAIRAAGAHTVKAKPLARTPTSKSRPTTEGGLIGISARGVVGWALDSAAPVDPVDVIIMAGKTRVSQARAEHYDLDLVHARMSAGTPGFVARLGALPEGPYPLLLTLHDVHGTPLGAPLSVACEDDIRPAVDPAALSDAEGMIDGLYGGLLLGWAWDRSMPGQASEVELFDGGERVDRAVADMARDDLKAAGKRGGRCGFQFQLPASMLDGAQHSLSVRAAGSGFLLPGGPIVFGPSHAKALIDEVAQLRREVQHLTGLVGMLTAPNGDLQRQIIRTLADRVAAMSEIQRELIEREIDALRAIALASPNIVTAGSATVADAEPPHANAAPLATAGRGSRRTAPARPA